jgi:crotonobetainyl-CoA:carnitine CoA-transferase CaiB-like acyl-CoA transferase
MSGALEHIKVVDVTAARAGPSCVRILADLGAQVIQVTRPGEGGVDSALSDPDRENLHRNKRSVMLDLQKPRGHEVFLRLVQDADVLVENFRPDVKHRLKIDYETLSALNPRLVYGSISGFGQDGPYGPRPGVDQIAQGMGGLMSITGPPGSGPWRVGIAICDLAAGMFLAHGIMAALLERERSGKGQWVQTSLLEACIALLDFQAARWLIDGDVAGQAGNEHPTVYPTGVFPTRDGAINIAATGDRAFLNFVNAIGLPELTEDERFKNRRTRTQHRPALREICEAKTQEFGSEELIVKLNDAGVPAGPILRIDEVFANPQVQHLQMAAGVDGPRGRLNLVRSAFNLTRTPPSVRTASPRPGEHTREVLTELGIDGPDLVALADEGVISQAR